MLIIIYPGKMCTAFAGLRKFIPSGAKTSAILRDAQDDRGCYDFIAVSVSSLFHLAATGIKVRLKCRIFAHVFNHFPVSEI
jgi:hypothetical protein